MFRRDVKNLGDVLSMYLRQSGLETPLLQRRIIVAWPSVVGEGIAAYTGQLFIKNQTLFVKVSNAALRADLTMMRSRICQRLNAAVGSMVIADVKIF